MIRTSLGMGAGVREAIRVSTKTLLEEPRAELTALHTLRLLPPSGLIDQARCCSESLAAACHLPCAAPALEQPRWSPASLTMP